MTRTSPILVAIVVMLAACGDSNVSTTTAPAPTTTTTTVSTTPPTTAASTTTTTPPTTIPSTTTAPTTTLPPTTTTTVAPIVYAPEFNSAGGWEFPEVLGSPGDPAGSGCAPPGDVLPNGVWFGYAEAVEDGVISFDLSCYYTGAAASAQGDAGNCDAEFGYCIVNQNPKVFSVAISPLAQVWYLATLTSGLIPVAPDEWPVSPSYLECPGERCGVWLYVNGGPATAVVEMFEE